MWRQQDHRIPGFEGEIIGPADPGYDQARTIWNAMIDRRPAVIAKCTRTADVVAAIRYAREADLMVSVRCGGHSIPGHSIVDGGLVIDLTHMQAVAVDAVERVARFEGGCLLSAVDSATQEHGLATPAGAVSHTGAGGLILGGGVGWLMRKHGLSVDNMLAAEVVTANGEVLRANGAGNPDLFWALRGGGGNFGVVTRFWMRLHERGPVLASFTAIPVDKAQPALRRWRDHLASAPDDLVWYNFFRWLPDYPWVPRDRIGQPVLLMAIVWLGDHAEGESTLKPILDEFADVATAQVKTVFPYVTLQTLLDELGAHGFMNYHKSGFMAELSESAIQILAERGSCLQTAGAQLELLCMGGAVERFPRNSTAFSHRHAKWIVNICGIWTRQEPSEPSINWVRETDRLLKPHLTGRSYVNFGGSESPGDGQDTDPYGDTWQRLREIKTKYDPDNFFRHNANIPPVPGGAPQGRLS